MQPVANNQQAFKTPSSSLWMSVAAALVCHCLILLSLGHGYLQRDTKESPLSVTIYQEPKPERVEDSSEQVSAAEDEVPETPPQTNDPVSNTEAATQTEDLIKSDVPASSDSKIRLTSVRMFLDTETQRHADENPDKVARFSETFESTYEKDTSPKYLARDMLPSDSGVFMATINGERRCGAKVIPMLSSGGLGDTQEVSVLHKPCEQKETFDLRLNRPRNPSMQ